jgi:hypothetical protein
MSSPTTTSIDPHRDAQRTFKQGFQLGREAGLADARARIEVAEMLADYWYFIANNPGTVEAQRKHELSYAELWEARAEYEQRRRWWDAMERQRFTEARAMLAAGTDPVTVAVQLELFLPIVENLQAGVL